eukprot:COSAG03_NODE_1932_length_3335_cov_3.273148_2_plen_153_part_00
MGLWAWGRRTAINAPHPLAATVEIETALLREPLGAAAARRALDSVGSAAAAAMGEKRRISSKGKEGGGESSLWRKGANSLLQFARARWVEAVCAIAAAPQCSRSDKAQSREALIGFLAVGRDCAARHMAFAVPSQAHTLSHSLSRSLSSLTL